MQPPVIFKGGPLSNFALCHLELKSPVSLHTRSYASVEHYFQASKASTLEDHHFVAEQATAREAKQAGRAIRLRRDWEDIKVEVMRTALLAKFFQDPWRTALLATGDCLIIEESRHDLEWGARRTYGGWQGQNRLGMLLMEVRATIAAEREVAIGHQLDLGV